MLLGRYISYISNPIFILLALPYFIIFLYTKDHALALFWTVFTWIFLVIFAFFVLIGIKKGFFTDYDVSKREQRFLLYLFAAILNLVYFFLLISVSAPLILQFVSVGVMSGILVGSIVNIKIKASVHVAAASAFITGISLVYGAWFYLLYLFIPIICWARLVIKRHTLIEVITGCLIGISLAVIMYLLGQNYLSI